jgi:formylglycine-generating enzyme required for sulfatase activity
VKNSFVVAALAAVTGLGASIASATVTVEFRTVGNAGNAGDPGNFGRGAVAYEYRIGAFEVTNAQYAEFLNAVAASDPRGLYNANMGTNPRGGITRSGTDGSFMYTVRPNMGNKPVNFVSFFDAARMANWLTNGQGSGSTESGVYTFSGAGIGSVTAITRDLSNSDQVFLPTENEWKKAALHRPASQGGDTDNFWRFATQSNDEPVSATATATGDIANPGPSVVNYRSTTDWNGQDGNLTTVGSAGNASFYGAFDVAGNVQEWLESTDSGGRRGITGGSFFSVPTFGIRPDDTFFGPSTPEDVATGIRFASPVPPPTCRADFNSDGFVDFTDFDGFVAAFEVGSGSGDFNNDGFVDFTDFDAFVATFEAGC